MELKLIELVFENCECATINTSHIGDFCIENIDRKITRVAVNEIGEMRIAKSIYIELFSGANKTDPHLFTEDQLLFDRIQVCNDITQVWLHYEDHTDVIFTDYDDGDEDFAPNKNQKVWLSECGNLYIVIDQNAVITDMLDMNEKNDKQRMSHVEGLVKE